MIYVKDLSKTINGEILFSSVSFSLFKGEVLCVNGPYSLVKVLFNIIGLLERGTSGVYEFDKEDVFSLQDFYLSKIRRDKISYVFKEHHFIKELNLFENLYLSLRYVNLTNKEKIDKINTYLKRLSLYPYKDKYIKEMPLLDIKKASILRGVLKGCKLLIFYDLLNSLREEDKDELFNFLMDLNKKGISLILNGEGFYGYKGFKVITLKGDKLCSSI